MNLNTTPALSGLEWLMQFIPKPSTVTVAGAKVDYMPLIVVGAIGLGALVLVTKAK